MYVSVCIYVCMYARVHVHMNAYIYVCMCPYMHMCISDGRYAGYSMWLHTDTYIHTG